MCSSDLFNKAKPIFCQGKSLLLEEQKVLWHYPFAYLFLGLFEYFSLPQNLSMVVMAYGLMTKSLSYTSCCLLPHIRSSFCQTLSITEVYAYEKSHIISRLERTEYGHGHVGKLDTFC